MKKIFLICFICVSSICVQAQENYGNTLNLGIGASYGSGYYGNSIPLFINYEITVVKNFTLAPFISFFTFSNHYGWHNSKSVYTNYNYRTIAIPFGVKGSYYFDELLAAGEKWDFYGAASLGFAYRKTTWDDGYAGPDVLYTGSGVYLDIHAGAEYHMNEKIGFFLDLSSGVSSVGMSIKTK